jgi:hypothetical protein
MAEFQQSRWNGEAKCLGGLEIDAKLELGRLDDRQIGGVLALECAIWQGVVLSSR